MDTQQRIIVVLLVLAIMFSVVSIFISFSVFTVDDSVRTGPSFGGNSANVQLLVESSTGSTSNG